MENDILLSIAIPTWNRASCLNKLLDNIMPQAKALAGEVEICVSNNASSDNTREIVRVFIEKYPDLIKYNENKENIGADKNILLLIEMSQGDFVWLFGDDDLMANGGLNEVVNFIKKKGKEKTGLIILGIESYLTDKLTGEKIIFRNSVNKNKPEAFEIDKRDIIGLNFPNIGFISVLIFNSCLAKKIIAEDKDLEKGIETKHAHMILTSLMFLKYPDIDGIALNKTIVKQELPQYKYFVENKFILHYQLQKKLNNFLLSSKYMNSNFASLFIQRDKELKWCFVADMIVLKIFKSFNYFSYFGCLKLFFQNSTFMDMLLFSFVFSILFLIPSVILRTAYKGLLIIRYGNNWKRKWELTSKVFYWASNGALIR
ncbi:MAG: glycosyltransferase family 2 protein [Patescibacteria group bacterium]